MFDIVLHEPEIAPNTGNIIRLCANAGARLHLIEPLGFALDDRRLRRAGLDYAEYVSVARYPSIEAYKRAHPLGTLVALTSRGRVRPSEYSFALGDQLLFGSETRGLPDDVLSRVPPERQLRLPMVPGSRSLNLSNAVAITLFEAWRQHDFAGAA